MSDSIQGRTTPDRHIRVFISSTFRDMQAEREILVKQLFPELRRLCVQRFVTFTEVDLRWGITEEQAAEGKVLPICLEEIHRSRPYFIGLLGERYGWIPDSVPPEVMAREPWLKEHVGGRTSVTELEILHGVLNNPDMASHAFFYFRSPAYVDGLPEEARQEMVERPLAEDIRKFGEAEAKRLAEESQKKLAALKERIRRRGLPVLENYPNPEALAAAVRRQFLELIDQLYPQEQVPDPLDQEAMGHEAYARGKLLAFVERPVHTAALDVFVTAESTGQGFVFTGESGSGKTALLASWVQHWRQTHPAYFVFPHYFGATPESASVDGFLRRLLGELKRRYGITDEIPGEPDKLREALPLWLAQTVGRGRIVLVLDALNRIQGDEPDRRLAFLPRYFPPHVRVLAATLPGPGLEALSERGWREYLLPSSDEVERDRMIEAFLEYYGKKMRPDLRRRLAAASGSANPLFMRTVLEELRQFGSFEKFPQLVAHYLEAETPEELFSLVLRRWQEDFDSGQDLVRRTLRPLWAARQGLAETEWLELLGTQEQPMARQDWAPLFFALEPHLSQRAGLYAFGHDFLRQAVQAEFLSSKDDQTAAHLALADYFEQQSGMSPRKSAEWPWQLHAAEAWERLQSALTYRELFLALYNERTKWELTAYWHPLRARGSDMGQSYTQAYNTWVVLEPDLLTVDAYLLNQLALFLDDNGCYYEAKIFLQSALERYEQFMGTYSPYTSSIRNNLAELLLRKGDIAQAEAHFRLAMECRERLLGPENPDTLNTVNSLGGLYGQKGDYAKAEKLFRRAFVGFKQLLGPDHPKTLSSLNNLAVSLVKKGDYTQAENLVRRALEGVKRIRGLDHPETLAIQNNLAFLLQAKGDYIQAENLYRCVMKSFEQLLGTEHLSTLTCIHNLADLLRQKGDYEEAEHLHRRALESRKRVLGAEHPQTVTSLNALGMLLYQRGEYDQAEPLFRQALEISERILGPEHPETLPNLNNLAFLLQKKGDFPQAENLFRRALKSSTMMLGLEHPKTLGALNNLAGLIYKQGDYVQAEILFREALKGYETLLGSEHPDTLISQNNLAVLLFRKGDYAQAEPLFRRALLGLNINLGSMHPNFKQCLGTYTTLLQNMGLTETESHAKIHGILAEKD